MSPCVFIIFSLLLLNLQTTTANHLVEGGDDNGVMHKCLDKERDSLLHFKAPLQDPFDSGCLSTWRADEHDCCKWSGVTCNNQKGHVTGLKLRSCLLEGEISHALLNLSNLNGLDLSLNSFHGTIPTFIGSLTELRYLSLSSNSLNGTIPTEFGNLINLNHLDLSYNSLHRTIPTFIGSLTELRNLDLSYNSLNGTIPLEFGNLTNLQELVLSNVGRCRVENLEWLSHLSHLEYLRMDGISLAKQNHWVYVILSLRKLLGLTLEGCELSQVMYPYSSFLNFSSFIEALYLNNNSLTSSMYSWLSPLISNNLIYLDLSSNMLNGIPNYLGDLCSLKHLYFFDNFVINLPDFLNNLSSGCTSLSLQLLDASYSQFTGSLPDEIQKFASLEYMDLSYNHSNGTIREKRWELPRLAYLDVSFNNLTVPSTDHMASYSYVNVINLRSCKVGPHFPKWIQSLKNLTRLDLSNTGISDTIPPEFWDVWPFQLGYLNLSSNNISGKVQDLLSNFAFDHYTMIDLSSNIFHGPIPNVPSCLAWLNLSRNKFSGGISFLCQIVDEWLQFLDLSHNSLSGQIPDCLWHFKRLKVLNLGHNNLYGRLPPSIGYLVGIEVLYLYNNSLSGELPLSLKNCTSLRSLNLGANKFSGNVPVWIGENLLWLYVLILRSNNFLGTIPLQSCQLPNLRILDLSMNNLHGTIPSCLSNLTSIVDHAMIEWQGDVQYDPYYETETYVDHALIEWQGAEREFFRNLRLLKSIDLSNNNLTGQIPNEITNMYELVALNLSKNALFGVIPSKIGEMKKLLTLDLSRNKFSGRIQPSMSEMTLLNCLDVSFNNLSGRIPSSTQLQSFQPSRYEGNTQLCGSPLTKKCPGDEESEDVGKSKGYEEGVDELERWFYIDGTTGFVTGFWIACGALLVNRCGRHAFFHFHHTF